MKPFLILALVAALCCAALAGCSLSGQPPSGPASKTVVVATHDSWAMPKRVLADFTKQTGYVVSIQEQGDAGELTNKLVLTKANPIADAEYGIDNTFATRAVAAGVFSAYTPPGLPTAVRRFALPGAAGRDLTPVDYGDVCVNVDDTWFHSHHLAPPRTFEDLTKPAYRNLFVTPSALTSSPGMAFLVATIGHFGGSWSAYWRRLVGNGVEIAPGWTQAFEQDYTAGGGSHATRPIVLSYSSDPAYTVTKGAGHSRSHALLDTCFRQIEYAGVLHGAANPAGARAFVRFMLSRQVQRELPSQMYVYPVVPGVPLPATWARFAPPATHPVRVSPATISARRNAWLRTWQQIAAG